MQTRHGDQTYRSRLRRLWAYMMLIVIMSCGVEPTQVRLVKPYKAAVVPFPSLYGLLQCMLPIGR